MKIEKAISIIFTIFCAIICYIYFETFQDNNFYMGLSQIIGGTIGGVATLIGVIFTLDYERKERKKDNYEADKRQNEQLRLQNLPVLQYEINTEKTDNSGIVIDLNENEENTITLPLNILIKNIGLNVANNILFQILIDNEDMYGKTGEVNALLFPKGEREETIYFNIEDKYANMKLTEEDMYKDRIDDTHLLKVVIYYEDLIGNHYAQILEGQISSNFCQSEDRIHVNYNVYINDIREAKIVNNEYIYEVAPDEQQEYELRKQSKIDMIEYQDNKYKPQIDDLVQKYIELNRKKNLRFIPKVYKKLDFRMGGGGMTKCIELKAGEIYKVTLSRGSSTDHTHHLNIEYQLEVNIKEKEVKLVKAEIVEDTLKVSKLHKFIAKIEIWYSKYL